MMAGFMDRFKSKITRGNLKGRISMVTCVVIILAVIYSNYYNKFWNDKGRIIAYDVISYYQYLPAAFIYKDLSMKFIEKDVGYFQNKIWASRMETGRYMGRMTMGLAVMYSPFFGAAHLLAEPLGFEKDGFSPPYRFALIMASIVYMGLGLFALRAFLKKYYEEIPVAITLLLTGLATNLYFYTVIEPTMSHAFSFCLFALFLLLNHRWLNHPSWLTTLLLGLIVGLIALVRPSNVIIVMLILLWDVGNFPALKDRLLFVLLKWDKVIAMFLAAFLVILPQLLYWKYNSGHWFTYTYNEEGFFFNNPQFIRGLFSYRKGWLVYTPVMIFAIAGLITLFIKNKKLFWPVFLFTLLNMYIIFSWWSWWYGGGFGQRALIESYAVLAVPMAAFTGWILERRWYLVLPFLLLSAWFIFLNIFQTRQYYFGSIHWEGMTREAYWDSFFRYRPSERFNELIRYPDTKKALQGVYEDLPVKIQVKETADTLGYEEYIKQMELKIRADSNWMNNIREKAEQWGKPVDSVIFNDARWLWEQKNNKNE